MNDVSELVALTSYLASGEKVVFDGDTEVPLPIDAYLADGREGKAFGVPQTLKWPYKAKRGKLRVTPERGSMMEAQGTVLNFRDRENHLLFQVVPIDPNRAYVNVCGECRKRRHMRRIVQA